MATPKRPQETAGDRIEAAAKRLGLGYGQKLADMLGVSYETLRRWKSGETAPNRSRQKVIAEVLGIPPAEFMFAEDVGWPFARLTPEEWAELGDLARRPTAAS